MAKTKQKLEKEIKELQSLLKDKGIVGEDRQTLEDALTHLEKQYKEWKDEPAATAKKSADKKSAAPKHEPAKEEKKKTFRVFGTEFHLDEDNCDLGEDLRKAFAARKAAHETTKKRTVPITKKIAGKIVDAIETAIKDVAAAEIKDNPKAFEKDSKKLVDAGEKFADAIAEFMGDDFKDNQAATEFKEIHKLVAELVKKHKK